MCSRQAPEQSTNSESGVPLLRRRDNADQLLHIMGIIGTPNDSDPEQTLRKMLAGSVRLPVVSDSKIHTVDSGPLTEISHLHEPCLSHGLPYAQTQFLFYHQLMGLWVLILYCAFRSPISQ